MLTNSNASKFSFEDGDPASGNGISHKCLRLNTSLNCTKLEGALDNSVDNVQYNRDKNVTAQASGDLPYSSETPGHMCYFGDQGVRVHVHSEPCAGVPRRHSRQREVLLPSLPDSALGRNSEAAEG